MFFLTDLRYSIKQSSTITGTNQAAYILSVSSLNIKLQAEVSLLAISDSVAWLYITHCGLSSGEDL